MRTFTEEQRLWIDLATILALALALWAGRPQPSLVEGAPAYAQRVQQR